MLGRIESGYNFGDGPTLRVGQVGLVVPAFVEAITQVYRPTEDFIGRRTATLVTEHLNSLGIQADAFKIQNRSQLADLLKRIAPVIVREARGWSQTGQYERAEVFDQVAANIYLPIFHLSHPVGIESGVHAANYIAEVWSAANNGQRNEQPRDNVNEWYQRQFPQVIEASRWISHIQGDLEVSSTDPEAEKYLERAEEMSDAWIKSMTGFEI